MKKITIALLVATLFFNGCADKKVIENLEYDTYGFLNESEKKNSNIQYELSIGNVILGIILVETIIAPVYFFGFSLYEPVDLKKDYINGVVK